MELGHICSSAGCEAGSVFEDEFVSLIAYT
jgi:hypothetical protein